MTNLLAYLAIVFFCGLVADWPARLCILLLMLLTIQKKNA